MLQRRCNNVAQSRTCRARPCTHKPECPTSHDGIDSAVKNAIAGYSSTRLYKLNLRAERPRSRAKSLRVSGVAACGDAEQRSVWASLGARVKNHPKSPSRLPTL